MITADQLAASMLRECDIIVHLFGKLPEGALDYRPTEGQRSTLELLRYLAMCGIGGIEWFATGELEAFRAHERRVADLPGSEFPAEMERQKAAIRRFFDTTPSETLATQPATLPDGSQMPLGAALMNAPLKWLAAYRMQLFLYAKAAGAADIGTANAWAGMDWRR